MRLGEGHCGGKAYQWLLLSNAVMLTDERAQTMRCGGGTAGIRKRSGEPAPEQMFSHIASASIIYLSGW